MWEAKEMKEIKKVKKKKENPFHSVAELAEREEFVKRNRRFKWILVVALVGVGGLLYFIIEYFSRFN